MEATGVPTVPRLGRDAVIGSGAVTAVIGAVIGTPLADPGATGTEMDAGVWGSALTSGELLEGRFFGVNSTFLWVRY